MNDEAIIAEPEIYITRLVPSTDDISGNSRDRSSFGSHVSEHIFRSVYSYTDLRLGMYLSFVEGDGRGTITDRTIALHFLFFFNRKLFARTAIYLPSEHLKRSCVKIFVIFVASNVFGNTY